MAESKNPDPTIGGPAAQIPPDQLVTEPSCAPLVPGDPETPEARELREARGDPPPRPLWGKGAQTTANKAVDHRPTPAATTRK